MIIDPVKFSVLAILAMLPGRTTGPRVQSLLGGHRCAHPFFHSPSSAPSPFSKAGSYYVLLAGQEVSMQIRLPLNSDQPVSNLLGLEVCAATLNNSVLFVSDQVLSHSLHWLPCTGARSQVGGIWPCNVSGPWLPHTPHRTMAELGSSSVQFLPKDAIWVSGCLMM